MLNMPKSKSKSNLRFCGGVWQAAVQVHSAPNTTKEGASAYAAGLARVQLQLYR